MSESSWPQRTLAPTPIMVGPAAWRATMLRPGGDGRVGYVLEHPSMIVFGPDDGPSLIEEVGPLLRECPDFPIMLGIHEPSLARRVVERCRHALTTMGRAKLDILMVWVESVQDLHASHLLDQLRGLCDEGLVDHMGLCHHEVAEAEWLARHTDVGVLCVPFSLSNQAAAYRAIPAAHAKRIACVAKCDIEFDTDPDQLALRFALGCTQQVLPVLDQPLPDGLTPMSEDEVAKCWQAYQEMHEAPPPIQRGLPPAM